MIAEILTTGDEICTGAAVDTNSAYIADKLMDIGVAVRRHVSVGDDLDLLADTLKNMGQDITTVIVTGGLGPTSDDITAEAAAKAAGCRLKLNADGWKAIQKRLQSRGFAVMPIQKKQALLPAKARLIPNPVGIAPGFEMEIGHSRFFFLPGVPREMKPMLSDSVIPRITAADPRGPGKFQVKTISCFGLGESALADKLTGFTDVFPLVRLGYRVKFPEVQVKLYGRGDDKKNVTSLLSEAAQWIAAELGSIIVSMSGDPMEMVVGQLLRGQKATIALAESCTGGLIAHMLTGVAGSSDYFLFSAVTYANEAKQAVLGVSEKTIAQHGAVSRRTAAEMARGARRAAGATYGLAVTGIAGPGGGSPDKPVGTVCIGLATPEEVVARRHTFKFDSRDMHKTIFAVTALDMLRQRLNKNLN